MCIRDSLHPPDFRQVHPADFHPGPGDHRLRRPDDAVSGPHLRVPGHGSRPQRRGKGSGAVGGAHGDPYRQLLRSADDLDFPGHAADPEHRGGVSGLFPDLDHGGAVHALSLIHISSNSMEMSPS